MNLMIMSGILVCSNFLNPLATMLFNVCSAVTVEFSVLYPCFVGVFVMFAVK